SVNLSRADAKEPPLDLLIACQMRAQYVHDLVGLGDTATGLLPSWRICFGHRDAKGFPLPPCETVSAPDQGQRFRPTIMVRVRCLPESPKLGLGGRRRAGPLKPAVGQPLWPSDPPSCSLFPVRAKSRIGRLRSPPCTGLTPCPAGSSFG